MTIIISHTPRHDGNLIDEMNDKNEREVSMEDQPLLEKLIKEIETMQRKVEELESMVHEKSRSSSSVWVLVPVAAIVMWGLTQIFG